MVKSIYRHSSSTVGIAQVTTEPNGVLSQLQRLEPGVDVSEKYTGTGCLYADEDQVVRRCLLRTSSATGTDSVVAKVLQQTELFLPTRRMCWASILSHLLEAGSFRCAAS